MSYLFKPYFQQYESWCDNTMDLDLSHLHSGHDIAVITFDFIGINYIKTNRIVYEWIFY